jgi:hypothetical protein
MFRRGERTDHQQVRVRVTISECAKAAVSVGHSGCQGET